MRTTRQLIADCEAEVERLRQAGWTQQDFAKALADLLCVEIAREAEQEERRRADAPVQ